MKAITERSLIRGVSTKWNKQYRYANDGNNKFEIGRQLAELDRETASAADVAQIIGNNSWTHRSCDECNAKNVDVVELGQEPDYESSTAQICLPCLEAAVALLKVPA